MNRKKQKLATQAPPNKLARILIIMYLLCCIPSCKPDNRSTNKMSQSRRWKYVELVVLDKSFSTNKLNYGDTSQAREHYNTLANVYGSNAVMKVISIGANSLEKDVQAIEIVGLDTTPLSRVSRNVYKKAKITALNVQLKEKYAAQTEAQIERYQALVSRPKNEPYTDVINACNIVKVTLDEPQYQAYKKVVIFYSDLVHNMPNRKHSEVPPIQLTNTTVICLRPLLSKMQLEKMFPGCPIYIFTSAKDINTFIAQL